jgi:hypothetical protein
MTTVIFATLFSLLITYLWFRLADLVKEDHQPLVLFGGLTSGFSVLVSTIYTLETCQGPLTLITTALVNFLGLTFALAIILAMAFGTLALLDKYSSQIKTAVDKADDFLARSKAKWIAYGIVLLVFFTLMSFVPPENCPTPETPVVTQ